MYVINDHKDADYGEGSENGTALNLTQKVSNHILVTGNISVTNGNANTNVAFKNCAPFTKCLTHINDEHINTAESLYITMTKYNLIEYSDNYIHNFIFNKYKNISHQCQYIC